MWYTYLATYNEERGTFEFDRVIDDAWDDLYEELEEARITFDNAMEEFKREMDKSNIPPLPHKHKDFPSLPLKRKKKLLS